MTLKLTSPWSVDAVNSLNEYQASGVMHPFTCGHGSHVLRATEGGWVCDECAEFGRVYSQDWAWLWMADWSWKKVTP